MSRILHLDMLRGFALICIMLDHMPQSVAKGATLGKVMIFDAAELFVLLSGFLVGLVWRLTEARAGRPAAQRRFARRAFEVWRALVIGALVMAALSAGLLALGLRHTAVWNGYAAWLLRDPLHYALAVGSMWLQPNLLDVLAAYVMLIASAALLVPLLLRAPVMFALGSALTWWFARDLNGLIPSHEPRGMLFNPFGWQMLFYAGVAMGLFRAEVMPVLRRYTVPLSLLALGMVAFGMGINAAARAGEAGQPVLDLLRPLYGRIDKWSLDGTRFLAIIAASWLVAVPLAGPLTRLAGSGAGRALSAIGRGGLWSFIACVLLSVLADAVQMRPGLRADTLARLAVDVLAVMALWALAEGYHRATAPRAPQPAPQRG